jgi:hypothetical protein
MREPCAVSKELSEFDDPLEAKWYNCKYDDEPRALDDKNAVDLFKKLCSPMYKDDNMKLCCSPNQLIILKKDIAAAEAVIGSCSSCFLNFRIFWCHMACDPNQAEFIIPIEYQHLDLKNLTQSIDNYEKSKHNHDNNEEEEHDPKVKRRNADEETPNNSEEAQEENVDEKEEHNADEESHDAKTNEDHHKTDNTEHDKKPSNTSNEIKVDAVTKVEYYISEEYLMGFIESCRLVDAFFTIQNFNHYDPS